MSENFLRASLEISKRKSISINVYASRNQVDAYKLVVDMYSTVIKKLLQKKKSKEN